MRPPASRRPVPGHPRGATFIATLAVSAIAAVAVTAQQQVGPGPDDLRRQQQQAELEAVAASKAEIASEIVSRWAAHGVELGFTPGWDTELTQALMGLDAERLLQARSAKSYRELNAIISGVSPATLERLTSAPTLLEALPTEPVANSLGDSATDLVYFPLTPCRIVDTRVAGGVFVNTDDRGYFADGGFAAQGGNPAGCAGISVADEPAAIAVNITITAATGSGFARAYPQGAPIPFASIINWGPGQTLANAAIIALGQNVGSDFRIRVDGSGSVHVIVDIMGYFWSPTRAALSTQIVEVHQANTAIGAGWNLTATCPAGTSLTGGGFDTSYISFNVSTGTLLHFESSPGTNAWSCRGWNNTSNVLLDAWCRAVCVRTPGR